MKILKKGKDPKAKVYKITCDNCETEFEFERKEARLQIDQRDGDCLTIKCPLCKTKCYVAI